MCCAHGQVFIIEANPRASRTVPFVAKAIGHPLAAYASLLMSGKTLADLGFTEEPVLNHVAVKEAVLPFEKFPGALQNLRRRHVLSEVSLKACSQVRAGGHSVAPCHARLPMSCHALHCLGHNAHCIRTCRNTQWVRQVDHVMQCSALPWTCCPLC